MSKTHDFTTLYLAVSIMYDGKYLTYLNPTTRDLSVFFCKKMEDVPGPLSHEELLQMTRILIDHTFIAPNNVLDEVSSVSVLSKTTDHDGNLLLCIRIVSDMDIDDALAIFPKDGYSNYVSYMGLPDVQEWEPKSKYTERFLPLLTPA